MIGDSITIKTSNRNVDSALKALEQLVETRGFATHETALRVGMTMRRLRDISEDTATARNFLVRRHAVRDAAGVVIMGKDGSISVGPENIAAFSEEAKSLADTEQEVEVWPITMKQLKEGASVRCEKCEQLIGIPEPEVYATLIDIGLLVETLQS